jgi:hypothetical protein
MKNPLDGISPDFTVFGAEFNSIWLTLAAGLWGLAILVAVGYLGYGVLGVAQSRNTGHTMQLRDSKQQAVNAFVALGGLVALPIIVGAIMLVFSP